MKAETALRRALVAAFAADGASLIIETIASRPWASATFSGTQHELLLRIIGGEIDGLIADIGDRGFDLPGHILIDVAANEIGGDGESRLLVVEALTVKAD